MVAITYKLLRTNPQIPQSISALPCWQPMGRMPEPQLRLRLLLFLGTMLEVLQLEQKLLKKRTKGK